MPSDITYLGIRHHGPGSARRVVEALDALQPAEVLVEGPLDLSDQLPLLANEAMVPPITQLAYPSDAPDQATFWPFAVFSPEYQAIRWALKSNVPVRYIDLPVAWQPSDPEQEGSDLPDTVENTETAKLQRDPIGVLAHAAGYEDGESWWNDVVEENPNPGPIFDAVAEAMSALREGEGPLTKREAAREAHMRLEIAKSAKESTGPIAVICGAFHVPALKAKHSAKDDRALVKGARKTKIKATWAPWTSPRLAFESGYGAGVVAPGWNKHLWDNPGPQQATIWITRIARILREEGQIVSTASLIETERLATSLASVVGRPRPGFEELRDATIACLCYGDPILWHLIERRLILGNEVGAIPEDVPAAPLLEDLQRQQKKARLKPEALERELSLDLRSDSGLFRSTLLHRLLALHVPWGKLRDAGKSRGTFRENWTMRWDPEYAVQLVENLVFGTSIEKAASARLTAKLVDARSLPEFANLVFAALTAQLPEAARNGISSLETRASQTTDCRELLNSLGPMVDIIRYGKARKVNNHQLGVLFERIAAKCAIHLQYAARDLDAEASRDFANVITKGHNAIDLADLENDLRDSWMVALAKVARDEKASRLVMGTAARLLYEAKALTADEITILMGRMLSPGTAVADAAAFFEGFFEGAGQRLLYDDALRNCVDTWLVSLDDQTFMENLPLFRRVLSALDQTEKRRLLDMLFARKRATSGRVLSQHAVDLWPKHFEDLKTVLLMGADHE